MNDKNNEDYKIYADKANGDNVNHNLDREIQIAYLNILHDQGVLPDKVHSLAIAKTRKRGI